jgi:hypothetical protein
MAKTYVGRLRDGEAQVLVLEDDGVRPLPNRARRPGLTFRWGRATQTSLALAQSLLWDVLACEPAPELAAAFTAEVLDHLPRAEFELEETVVRAWLSGRGVRALSAEQLGSHVGRVAAAARDDLDDLLCDFIERCWDAHTLLQ